MVTQFDFDLAGSAERGDREGRVDDVEANICRLNTEAVPFLAAELLINRLTLAALFSFSVEDLVADR